MSADVIKKHELVESLFGDSGARGRVATYASVRARLEWLERELQETRERAAAATRETELRARQEEKNLAAAEYASVLAALADVKGKLESLAAMTLKIAEEELLDLVMAVSEKVLAREIRKDDSFVPRLVGRCLRRLALTSPVTIRVNGCDLAKVSGALGELARGVDGRVTLRAVEDAAVAPGGCVVETPEFLVDGRIDSQLGQARRTLERGGS